MMFVKKSLRPNCDILKEGASLPDDKLGVFFMLRVSHYRNSSPSESWDVVLSYVRYTVHHMTPLTWIPLWKKILFCSLSCVPRHKVLGHVQESADPYSGKNKNATV